MRGDRLVNELNMDDDIVELFQACSNEGRWGPADELGTLNHITDAKRLEAARLVTLGTAVELGRSLRPGPSAVARSPLVQHMLLESVAPSSAVDLIEVTPHDPSITHVDALCHVFWEGRAYNGRSQRDVMRREGLTFGSLGTHPGGVVTRGVLLDVAATRKTPWLSASDFVTAADLDAAERLAGVSVGVGDAVVVHVGRDARVRAEGGQSPLTRAGLHANALPWLFDRGVSVYTGDCTERLPYPSERVPFPLHQVGLVAMGLCMVDSPATEPLVNACESLRRCDFLFTFSAPRIAGATGFPVNPVCLF